MATGFDDAWTHCDSANVVFTRFIIWLNIDVEDLFHDECLSGYFQLSADHCSTAVFLVRSLLHLPSGYSNFKQNLTIYFRGQSQIILGVSGLLA